MRAGLSRRLRWAAGAAAVLAVVVGCALYAWPGGGQARAAAQAGTPSGSAAGSASSADRASLLSAARREIADLSSPGTAQSRRLGDPTGALHQAVADASSALASGAPGSAPGTVTAVAVTTLDSDAGTAKLIATVQLPATGEQRLDASMAQVGGAWKLAALAAVPVGAVAASGAAPGSAGGTGVTAEVGGDLARILSYAPGTTAATRQAADQVLAGTAASQYRQLFGGISAQVGRQGLTVRTQVVRIGVQQQSADRAQLLVFLDQTARRTGQAASSVGAQLSVTAQLSAGHWHIVELASR